MPSVEVDQWTYDALLLHHRLTSTPMEEVVRHLCELAVGAHDADDSLGGPVVAIRYDYRGQRVNAAYDRRTKRVYLDQAIRPDGKVAKFDAAKALSSSGAACDVMRVIAPDVAPNRNGWDVWVLPNGQPLQSIRYENYDS